MIHGSIWRAVLVIAALKKGKVSIKGTIKITDASSATVASIDLDLTVQ